MFVVRKFDFELPVVFWLRRLIRAIRFAKSEPALFARRGAQVTDRADGGAGAAHRLTREKLLPVTTHARVVIGKVSGVWKCTTSGPCRRNLVAGVALEAFVFVGRM